MYKRIYILIVVLFSLVVSSCTKDDDFFSAPGLGRTLIDTTLNVSQREVTVTLSEGITVTVPKGLSSKSFSMKIREVDMSVQTPAVINLLKAFDIELSIGEEFEKEIIIRVDFEDDDLSGDVTSNDLAFGFYNTYNKKWAVFPDYEVNLDKGYAVCRTNHLTTVGVWEFVSSGGYSHKFIGDNITVYYTLRGDDAPMDYSEYLPDDKTWHLPSGHKNWAPIYIQDIAHYTAEARKLFAASPHNLNVSKGNINIYVKDMNGSDGEYGTISGAIYINNTVKIPTNVSGVEGQDVLKATCAHELMHFIQDNYYVMNKGSIGMWWLEATATQADRMAWGNSLTYSESELFAIESNSALLENLSKSWDDCNSNPNWYLAGCFLQYLSTYRMGEKLNVAKAIKQGGSGASLVRVMLNDIIKSDLETSITDEFHDYVLYLFIEGNENLTAFPVDKDFSKIETASSLTKQVKMSKKDNKQTVEVSLPYMSAKLISVSNLENTDMMYSYTYLQDAPGVMAYLCKVDKKNGMLDIVDRLSKDDAGNVELKARVGGDADSFIILLINMNFTEGKKTVKYIFETAPDFKDFDYMSFKLEGDENSFKYSNGSTDNAFEIGFVKWKGMTYDENLSVVTKSFAGNKVKLTIKKSGSYLSEQFYQLNNFVQTTTITGEYSSSEFVVLNLKEVITGTIEEWSDKKNKWVDHTVTINRELEYVNIPFNVTETQYGNVYSYIENNNSTIKSKLKKLSETVSEVDDEGESVKSYSLQPLNWNSLPSYFNATMTTTKP